jgi:hypothetical protein
MFIHDPESIGTSQFLVLFKSAISPLYSTTSPYPHMALPTEIISCKNKVLNIKPTKGGALRNHGSPRATLLQLPHILAAQMWRWGSFTRRQVHFVEHQNQEVAIGWRGVQRLCVREGGERGG